MGRTRAPDSNLDSWYWECFGAAEIGRDTLRELVTKADGSTPSMLTFCRMVALWGPDFGDEILHALTGVRCSSSLEEAEKRIAELETAIDKLNAVRAGGEPGATVTRLPQEGKAS